MPDEKIADEYPDDEDVEAYASWWNTRWGENSPWDQVWKPMCSLKFDSMSLTPETFGSGNLLEAYEAANWVVRALGFLQGAYHEYKFDLANCEGTWVLRQSLIEHVAWFTYNTFIQLKSGDWEAIEVVRFELASSRIRPARLGSRRRQRMTWAPARNIYAPSMAGLVLERQRSAVIQLFQAGAGELFNAAIEAVPEDLREAGGQVCPDFSRTVALASP
jgi:hypothetical protein